MVYDHIINKASCQICGAMEETISHSLFHCTHAIAIWNHIPLKSVVAQPPFIEFPTMFYWVKEKVITTEFLTFLS